MALEGLVAAAEDGVLDWDFVSFEHHLRHRTLDAQRGKVKFDFNRALEAVQSDYVVVPLVLLYHPRDFSALSSVYILSVALGSPGFG